MTKAVRLFNKNVIDCESAKMCIVDDVCPVSVPKTPFQGSKGLINGGGNYNSLKVAKCLAV